MTAPHVFARIRDVRPGEGRTVFVTFADGATVHVDLASLITPGTVFEVLADDAVFRAVQIGPRGRSFGWPGGLDLDADALLMDPATSGTGHTVLSRTAPRPTRED